MKTTYFQHEFDQKKLVRFHNDEHFVEEYNLKEKKWVENNDRYDVVLGLDPWYKEITEEEFNLIVENFEK